jgi:phospholipase/carboxylesterase
LFEDTMSALPDLGFIHNYVPATDRTRPPLLLLHGTGGDENDLLPFGERLAPGAALLSPRGKVSEQGASRFFRRLAEGVFDLEDLAFRTQELADFIERSRKTYGIAKPIAFGFSNGANVAASLLLTRPDVLAGAVLLRATTPFEPTTLPDLTGIPVLMLSGASDPLVEPKNRDKLAEMLNTAGASVTHEVVPAGHNLSPRDIAVAERWLALHR